MHPGMIIGILGGLYCMCIIWCLKLVYPMLSNTSFSLRKMPSYTKAQVIFFIKKFADTIRVPIMTIICTMR